MFLPSTQLCQFAQKLGRVIIHIALLNMPPPPLPAMCQQQ